MKPASMHTAQPALKWLFRRARTARLWIALSVGLGFGSGLLLIAQAALIAHLIHAVFIEALPRSELTRCFVLFAIVVAGRAVMAWAREIAGFQAGARVRVVELKGNRVVVARMDESSTVGADASAAQEER